MPVKNFGINILKNALTPTQTTEKSNKSNHNGQVKFRIAFNVTYSGIMILP